MGTVGVFIALSSVNIRTGDQRINNMVIIGSETGRAASQRERERERERADVWSNM